jgi:hypothetical protein
LVVETVAARRYRPFFEMATNVFRELVHGFVAVLGFFAERPEDDGVEVAGEATARFGARDSARGRGLLLADGANELEQQNRVHAIKRLVGEEPVEHDPERVDVARRREKLGAHLLKLAYSGVIR